MSAFTRDGINEFRRDKPENNGIIAFSIMHKIIPIVICLLSLVVSTQFLAGRLGYDPAILGYPWFIVDNYPVYYPFLVLPLIIRGIAADDQYLGKVIFDSTMIMVTGIFTGVMLYFVLAWTRTALSRKQNIHGTARWGNSDDIRAIGLYEDSGVVIGQEENAKVDYAINNGSITLSLRKASTILRHSGQVSTVMFAPTRSGKGVSSVIPTCIDYPHSLIIIDPKGENYNITAGWRKKFSHVLRLSPVSNETLKFNMLDELSDSCAYRDASMIADILTSPADGNADGSSKHWIDTAKDLLTGAILHVKFSDYCDKSLGGVLTFLSQAGRGDNDNDAGIALLDCMIDTAHSTPEIHEIVCNVAQRNKARPNDERGSVFSSAVTALQVFEDPMVRFCSSASDFCLNDFVTSEHPISLYITVPFSDLDRLSSFIRTLISFMLRKFSQGEIQYSEQKLKHPILFLIDEFPTLGTFTTLETMMGILAGYGITFYLICQSPSQIYRLYGEHTAIFDHCKFIVTYAMSDPKGAEMFSKMTGIESVTYSSFSNSGNRYEAGMNNINISEQIQQRNLMNADEIQHLPANQLLIFPQGSPAIIAKKNVYYSDPRYMDKVNLQPPGNRRELLDECPADN